MGRKTFETFPKPLPNREHIVITRDKDYVPKFECTITHSIEEALALVNSNENAFIIGGGEIYKLALPLATHIELTRIHECFDADTFFPEFEADKWELIAQEFHPKDDKHLFEFTYLTFERKL